MIATPNLSVVPCQLQQRGATTKVTVRVQVLNATPGARENLVGMRDGWSESLDRLAGLEMKAAGG